MKSIITSLALTINLLLFGQNPSVINTTPIAQSLTNEINHTIQITFDQAIDPSTITAESFMVFGRWSGPMQGTYSFSNANTIITFTPDRDFFFGEWITVRLASSIQVVDGDFLTHGFAYNYWTNTLPSTGDLTLINQFSTEQNGETFIQSYGAFAGDVNDDEFSDLVVVTEVGNDIRVLLNDETGNYDPSEMDVIDMPNANKPSTNDGADFNHDGRIDLAIGSTQNNNVSVFIGNTTTIFNPEVSYTTDTGVRGLAVIDVNGDGWDDIATANRDASNYSILMNDGTGDFNTAITTDLDIVSETSIAAADVNNDGIIDLAIGGFASNNVTILLNDGNGNFTQNSTVTISGSPWMLAAGDVNGDGNVDFVSANSSNGEVSVLVGDGTGNLSLIGEYPSGMFTLAIDLGDLDGDGDLDFIGSNFLSDNFTYYENDGLGTFSNPVEYTTTGAGSCAIFHDRNNDGAMDLTLIDELDDIVYLYGNEPLLGTNNNSIDNTIRIYPNPFNNTINITGITNDPYQIKLTDLQGQIIFDKKITNTKKVNLSGLALSQGIYIVEITQGKTTHIQRLVK